MSRIRDLGPPNRIRTLVRNSIETGGWARILVGQGPAKNQCLVSTDYRIFKGQTETPLLPVLQQEAAKNHPTNQPETNYGRL